MKSNHKHTLFLNYTYICNDRSKTKISETRGGETAIIITKEIKFNIINLNNDEFLRKRLYLLNLKLIKYYISF